MKMDDEFQFPYLMHKRTFIHVPNNRETRERHGDEFVPITEDQARGLSEDRQKAGLKIMQAVVAADNAAALAEAQARTQPAEPEVRDIPAPPPAPVQDPAPWGAKKAK